MYEALFGGSLTDRAHAVDKMLAGVASHFVTQGQLDGLQTFFQSRKRAPGDPLPPFVRDAVSQIQSNMYIGQNVIPKVCDWAARNVVLADVAHGRQ